MSRRSSNLARAVRAHSGSVALLAASSFLLAPARAQEAASPAVEAELPPIEVTTTQPTKYPTAKVQKKTSPGAAAPAAEAPAAVDGAAGTGSADAIPSIATSGSILEGGTGEGSGQTISPQQLYTSHVLTANEALRTVPGVVVRDEEGFGMRPNIGIRGMNPTRSTKTLLMEDGIFLTYAPYGDNASYFHPLMDRFASVEVIKGADQLLYGPHTISGTINYLTPNPPKKPGGFAALSAGSNDYLNGQVYYGGWWGNFGGQIDYVHKEGDGARDNDNHKIDDIGFKGIWQLNSTNAIILKASAFAENSQVTYSGITENEFENFGIRYNPFKNDTFDTERYALSATHNWDVTPILSVASSAYWNSFSRDWWRQSSRTTDSQCGAGFRNARRDGNPVNVDACASLQGRLREYETYGFEQRFTLAFEVMDDVRNTLKAGYRIHREEQRRAQVNTNSPFLRPDPSDAVDLAGSSSTPNGANPTVLGEKNERETEAYSTFVQNKLEIGDFSVTPAFRYESIENTRINLLENPGAGQCASPPCSGSAEVSEFIPGISVGYSPMKALELFAGIHEGFAPPRVEDAIGQNGGSVEIDADKSTNIEVGFRSQVAPGVKLDGTYFRNDFDNLVAVGSIAGGETNYAQGEALFEGFELFGRIESGPIMRTSWSLYGQMAWTYLWDAEQLTAFSRVTNDANNGTVDNLSQAGNRLPYAPEHTVTARIGYAQRNFDAHVEMVYVGEQFADFANFESAAVATGSSGGVANSLNGMFGKIDAYTIFNLGMTYTYEPTDTDLYLSVKNLFDEEYIVDRTRGILPGSERLFQVGVKQKF